MAFNLPVQTYLWLGIPPGNPERERYHVTRSEKAAVIEAIKANAERASFAVLTEFKGMTVEELTNLRVNLRKAGGEFYVVKNTLARIAFTGGTHDLSRTSSMTTAPLPLVSTTPWRWPRR